MTQPVSSPATHGAEALTDRMAAYGWQPYPPDPTDEAHTVVGNVWILHGVHSPQLDNHRDILVYLPPSYNDGTRRRYPVLYMHDGHNLFDEKTSYAEEWRVDNTMDRLSRDGLEALVVGVPNMGEQRVDEYSPFRSPAHGGGKGDRYLAFLTDTLKPRIDQDFRTRPDRDATGIIGSSLGGLISLYAFFRRPDVFGMVGALSPSLWFAGRAIFPFITQVPYAPGRLYVDVGTLEGERTVANVQHLRDLLLDKGYRGRHDLLYVEQEDVGHTETAWRRRFHHTVPFLLHGTLPPEHP